MAALPLPALPSPGAGRPAASPNLSTSFSLTSGPRRTSLPVLRRRDGSAGGATFGGGRMLARLLRNAIGGSAALRWKVVVSPDGPRAPPSPSFPSSSHLGHP